MAVPFLIPLTRSYTLSITFIPTIKKKIIAQKGAALIQDGMFVLTSGGTTVIELARALPPQLKATFISGSIPAVLEYMQHPNIEVILNR